MAWREEQIGDCRLILADCLDVLPTLCKVDAVVTDPPYGVGFEHWDSKIQKGWLDTALKIAPTILVMPGVKNAFFWDKPSWIASFSFPIGFKRANGGGLNAWEPVLIYGKNTLPLDHKQFAPIASEFVNGHPCAKPLAPMKWLIKTSTKYKYTILDPFMGSGTTGVACVKLGRKFIGVEIEERYFDIACRRIEEAYKQPDFFIEQPKKPQQPDMLKDSA
jgi:DNA modification methylase